MWIPLFCRPTDNMRSNPPQFHRPFGTERIAQYLNETGTKKYSSPPLIHRFTFHGFSYLWSPTARKQMIFTDIVSEGQQQPSTMSKCLHHLPHLISLQTHLIFTHHHKGEYSKIRYFKRPHSHTPYYSILL